MRLDELVRVSKVAGRSGESFIAEELQREEIDRWAHGKDVEIIRHEPELDV
jgi:NOL1/NOP2/fmu family ribosome biogenesis protein